MMRVLILVALLPLQACALLNDDAETVGDLVREACTAPRDARELILARVNEHATPHAIELRCAATKP